MRWLRKVTTTPSARKRADTPPAEGKKGGALCGLSQFVSLLHNANVFGCRSKSRFTAALFQLFTALQNQRTYSTPLERVALLGRKVSGWLVIGKGWLHWQFGDDRLVM